MLSRLFWPGYESHYFVYCCHAGILENLHSAASHPSGPDIGLSRARPPVFGLRKDRMVRQVRQWGWHAIRKSFVVS